MTVRTAVTLRAALAAAVLAAAAPAQNPILSALPGNTARNLGSYASQCADSSFDPDNCRRVGDYSRFTYDPERHRIYFFGGGHSSTMRDDIDVFSFDSLRWRSDYASTRCSEMTSVTTDGTWSSTGHPVARHTYDQLIYATSVHRLVVTSPVYGAGYCGTYGDCGEWCAGKMLFYDPDTKTWTAQNTATNGAHVWSSEYDPVSGRIVSVGGQGLSTYDPVTDTKVTHLSNSPITDYADNLVYFPANDRFYYFSRGTPIKVYEVTLNRSSWASSTIQEVTGMAGTPATGETGWACDTANHVIGGGVADGVFHAFDPLTRAWTAPTMQVQGGGAGPTCYFHCLEYDPVDQVFIFYGEDFNTWAYCYRRMSGAVAPGRPKSPGQGLLLSSCDSRGWIHIRVARAAEGTGWSLKAFDGQGRLVEDLTSLAHGGELVWKPPVRPGLLVLRLADGRAVLAQAAVLTD